jgi:hypothetical protein
MPDADQLTASRRRREGDAPPVFCVPAPSAGVAIEVETRDYRVFRHLPHRRCVNCLTDLCWRYGTASQARHSQRWSVELGRSTQSRVWRRHVGNLSLASGARLDDPRTGRLETTLAEVHKLRLETQDHRHVCLVTETCAEDRWRRLAPCPIGIDGRQWVRTCDVESVNIRLSVRREVAGRIVRRDTS